ncbi:MAG: peptidase T [Bacteroidales bacterium]|nr:peptidase T [Bacteroidales bacterium]
MNNELLQRFLRYAAIDTQSSDNSTSQPSTTGQWKLLHLLQDELTQMGIHNSLSQHGYLYAHIHANTDKPCADIGFVAHVDTSPDVSGKDIKPCVIENYTGVDILLNAERDIWLRTAEYPELRQYKGKTIIATDGTTLLGADDNAGVAAIMQAAETLVSNPSIKHGRICIAFTPDEEVGRGTENFDLEQFGAQYAYTIDGGAVGELEYECFNAASATISISGHNIHPGYAKDRMTNALLVAMEINAMLPDERPDNTEGYEGFFHLTQIYGTVEQATMHYIIRDHNDTAFKLRKQRIINIIDTINHSHGKVATVQITDSYRNMRQFVEPHMEVVDWAKEAMRMAGVEPVVVPIRGGTDGSALSARGLPCPNIFAGGHNFHSRMEYVPLQSIEKATAVIINILQVAQKK